MITMDTSRSNRLRSLAWLGAILILAACAQAPTASTGDAGSAAVGDTQASNADPSGELNPCAVLTDEEVSAVIGEDTFGIDQSAYSNGAWRTCIYPTEDVVGAVQVMVTTNDLLQANDEGDAITTMAHYNNLGSLYVTPAPGFGDEAVWHKHTPDAATAWLVVRKGTTVIQIEAGSGGKDTRAAAETLARQATARLP